MSTQFKTRQQVFDEYPQEFYQLMVQNNLSEGDEQQVAMLVVMASIQDLLGLQCL